MRDSRRKDPVNIVLSGILFVMLSIGVGIVGVLGYHVVFWDDIREEGIRSCEASGGLAVWENNSNDVRCVPRGLTYVEVEK